jgi:hypothetical protein
LVFNYPWQKNLVFLFLTFTKLMHFNMAKFREQGLKFSIRIQQAKVGYQGIKEVEMGADACKMYLCPL